MMLFRLILALLTCTPFANALAAENTSKHFGLAMHGAAKHSHEDTHFAYANPDAPKGGHIKMAAIGTFDTLNPYALKGKAAVGLNLIYDRLMRRNWDEPFTMYPLIAKSYEMPEDRSSITFHLNPDAQFSSGQPIRASDVKFSFDTLKEHGRPNMRRVYGLVDKIETPDFHTISFHFKPEHDSETALIIAMMPVLSKAFWSTRTFDKTILEPIISSGPYVIKDFDPGRSITYKRNPGYWGKDLLANKGHYNFDEITYEYFRDDSVALEAFASGDLDLRRENNIAKWQNAYDFDVAKEQLSHGRPEKARGFIFNTRRPLFQDIRVREALFHLLNRPKINELLFDGELKFIRSYFPNSPFEYQHDIDQLPGEEAIEEIPFNTRGQMRAASNLLKDAGWTVENGVQMKDGQPFTFEVLLENPQDEKIALNFQQSLKRLGIEMRVRVADSAGFLRRIKAYDYDMVLHHWQSSLSPGTEQVLYWGCEAAKQEGRFNYPGICDPDIDALSKQVAFTQSRKELVQTMQVLDAKLLEGYYMIPLFYKGADYVAYKHSIKRPKNIPLYGMVLESWWMDQDNPKN